MGDDFEKLKLLTAGQISNKTHITKNNINNILSKAFDQFDKIQFNGFVSILEREYSLDLQELRDEYNEYIANNNTITEPNLRPISTDSDKSRGFFWIFILAIIIIIIVWFLYAFVVKKSNHQHSSISLNATTKLTNTTAVGINSTNATTTDLNATNTITVHGINTTRKILKPIAVLKKQTNNKQNKHVKPKIAAIMPNLSKTSILKSKINKSAANKPTSTVKLFTKSKLWLGITDMKTWKQQQKIVASSLDLNSTGDYLLILGHGMVQIQTNDKNISFPQTKTVFLMLKNGQVTQLTRAKFSKLNKGKLW